MARNTDHSNRSGPLATGFEVRDMKPAEGIDAKRQERRRKLLAEAEGTVPKGRAEAMTTYYRQAQELITSPAALKRHSTFQRNRQPCGNGMATPRLVSVLCWLAAWWKADAASLGWITAGGITTSRSSRASKRTCSRTWIERSRPDRRPRQARTPQFDARGADGEMGRTPRVNGDAGRDHWSMAQSVVFAGGGTKPGQVLGATDKTAAYPTTDPVSVPDLVRTIFNQMGVDTTKVYHTQQGRPVPIVDGGKLIKDLV